MDQTGHDFRIAEFILVHKMNAGDQLTRWYNPAKGTCIIVARTPEAAMQMAQLYDQLVKRDPNAGADFSSPLVLTDALGRPR